MVLLVLYILYAGRGYFSIVYEADALGITCPGVLTKVAVKMAKQGNRSTQFH